MSDLTPEIQNMSVDEAANKIKDCDVIAELVHDYANNLAGFLFDFDKTLHKDQDGVHIGWTEHNDPLQNLLSDLYENTAGAVAGISGRPAAFFIARLPKLFELGMPLGVEFGAIVIQGDNDEKSLKHEISRRTMQEVQKIAQEAMDEVNAEHGNDGQEPIAIEGHKKTCRTILYDLIEHDGVTASARAQLVDILECKIAEYNETLPDDGVKFRVQNSKQVDILPVYPDDPEVEGIGVDNGKHCATHFIVNEVAGFSGVKDGSKKMYAWGDSSGDLPMFKAVKEFGGKNIIVTQGFPEEHMDLVDAHNGECENNLSLLKFLVDTPKNELIALVKQNNEAVYKRLNTGALDRTFCEQASLQI